MRALLISLAALVALPTSAGPHPEIRAVVFSSGSAGTPTSVPPLVTDPSASRFSRSGVDTRRLDPRRIHRRITELEGELAVLRRLVLDNADQIQSLDRRHVRRDPQAGGSGWSLVVGAGAFMSLLVAAATMGRAGRSGRGRARQS